MSTYNTGSRLVVFGMTMIIAGVACAEWTSEAADRFSATCAASVLDAGAPQTLNAQAQAACVCLQNGLSAHVSESDYATFSRLGAVEQAKHPAAPELAQAMFACADRADLWVGDADRKGGPLPHVLLESIVAACVTHAEAANNAQGRAVENWTLHVSRACQCTTDGVRDATSPRMLFRAVLVTTPYTRFFHEMITTIETSCRRVILGDRPG